MFGGMEAGGTKFDCGVGNRPDDLEIAQFPTTTPAEILDKVVGFFKQHTVSAVGVASFGSVDLDISSSSYGYITSRPGLMPLAEIMPYSRDLVWFFPRRNGWVQVYKQLGSYAVAA